MLKVNGIHTKSPNTSMNPNLSAIMSQLYKEIKFIRQKDKHACMTKAINYMIIDCNQKETLHHKVYKIDYKQWS